MKIQNLKQYAFSLIEIIVVIAILALLTVAIVPSYRNFMQNNMAQSTTKLLSDTFDLAKAEAIRSGQPVTVCPVNPTNTTNCVATNNWSAWKSFTDTNGTGNFMAADGDTDITVYTDIPDSMMINNASYTADDSSTHSITFNAKGYTDNNYSFTVGTAKVDANGETTMSQALMNYSISRTGLSTIDNLNDTQDNSSDD